MGRTRRRITSGKAYEVCFRAREGLPFVTNELMNLVINSVVARKQHDEKVNICHDIWNGSHAHMLLVALDAQNFFKFLGETQKEVTEIIKRLLGIGQLNLWEGSPSVIEVLDLEAAIDRIAYFYANPAQDNLVSKIEKYPGVSSWSDFQRVDNTVDAAHTENYPWLRLPSIPLLESPSLTHQQAIYHCHVLKKENKKQHAFVRKPNLWMKSFGITAPEEVREINSKIVERLRIREHEAEQLRKKLGKSVIGVDRLMTQPIMKAHKPKKKDRKIYCISTIKELRIRHIENFKQFCEKCRNCFEKWLIGDFNVEWPPGAFKPPIRPSYNILAASVPKLTHFEFLLA
jgi:hypothetical protein